MSKQDTIVAPATAPGVGALGIIRLSGPDSLSLAKQVWKGEEIKESHRVVYGNIVNGEELLDEVLLTYFKAPRSYTKEDVIEISTHGSPYVMQSVIQLLIDRGARMAQPGEFTMRAFLNGRIDLAQAEAVADLIASDSKAAQEVALKQMRGGFSKLITELREQLLHFASMIELELDFSEEDVEFADRKQLIKLITRIQSLVTELSDSFRLGNVLKQGVSTVIAGKPNVGKSTLLNALLKEERAIVSDIPGTTRDSIEEKIVLEGIPFRFIDTAGLRDASDKIEALGVERTLDHIERSAVLIYLFDVNETSKAELDEELKKFKRDNLPLIPAGNKIDLAKKGYDKDFGSDTLFISGKEETELDKLKERLIGIVRNGQGVPDTVVSNARHYEALTKTASSLQNVREGIDEGRSGDLLAPDIRLALQYLGEITGEITTDDLLAHIFEKFCIGK